MAGVPRPPHKAKKRSKRVKLFQSTFVHPKIELRITDRIQIVQHQVKFTSSNQPKTAKHAQKKIDNFTQEVEFIVKTFS